MSDLLKLEDGTIIRAVEYEVVTPEELQQIITETTAALAEIQSFLPQQPVVPEVPLAPPAEVPPAQPDQPINSGTSNPDPAIADPALPVDQTATAPPAPIIQ